LLDFERENYGRKDTKGRAEAREMVKAVLARLLEWPSVAGNRQEPYPPKSGEAATKEGWLLFKIEFHTPRLTGDPGCGRLVYLVHKDEQIIMPLVVYTHKQYLGRVPNQTLEEMIENARFQKKQRDARVQAALETPATDPEQT